MKKTIKLLYHFPDGTEIKDFPLSEIPNLIYSLEKVYEDIDPVHYAVGLALRNLKNGDYCVADLKNALKYQHARIKID